MLAFFNQNYSFNRTVTFTSALRNTIFRHRKQSEQRVDRVGDLTNNFKILKKCQGNFDCLIHEMLWIRMKKPSLNTQSDSIRAKVAGSLSFEQRLRSLPAFDTSLVRNEHEH